ncbi:MAG: hypothetical protein AB7K09_15460 [Planctomycetota bacterium]
MSRIPPLIWVRVALPANAPWPSFIGFTYVDAEQGLSAGGFPEIEPDIRSADWHSMMPVIARLAGQMLANATPLDEAERIALGVPDRPAWVAHYGPQPAHHGCWADDPALQRQLHADYPDDLPAMFMGNPATDSVPAEQMWVRLIDREDSTGWYIGRLLNAPHVLTHVKQGDTVRLRITPGCDVPVYVGPHEAANLEAWDCRCEACAFDLLPADVAWLMQKQFPDLPEGGTMAAFTTRCPQCSGAMIVRSRSVED